MKNLIFIFAILGLIFTSCEKETLTPNTANQSTNNGNGSNTLDMEFAVKAIVPVSEVDSVVFTHWDNMGTVELEKIVIIPSVNIPTITNNLIFNSNDVIGLSDSLDPMNEKFTIDIFMNTSTDYVNPQNVFEMGTTNSLTASSFLNFSIVNGLGRLSGYDEY